MQPTPKTVYKVGFSAFTSNLQLSQLLFTQLTVEVDVDRFWWCFQTVHRTEKVQHCFWQISFFLFLQSFMKVGNLKMFLCPTTILFFVSFFLIKFLGLVFCVLYILISMEICPLSTDIKRQFGVLYESCLNLSFIYLYALWQNEQDHPKGFT